MKNYLITIRVCWLLRTAPWVFCTALGVSFFASAPAMAEDWRRSGSQKEAVCQGRCGGGCGPCSSDSNNNSGSTGNSSGGGLVGGVIKGVGDLLNLLGSSSDDKVRQQHLNEAARLNKQGLEYWERGDVAAAAKYFQRALLNSPNDQNIRDNLANALTQVRIQQQAKAARIERERLVEEQRKKDNFNNLKKTELKGSSGMYRSFAKVLPGSDGLKGSEAVGSNTLPLTPFSSGSVVPSKAELVAHDKVDPGTNINAGAQLKGVEQRSVMAAPLGNKEEAGIGFDNFGRESGNLGTLAIRPDKPDRRSAALAAKIPKEAWKDPLVGQLYGNFKKLSAIKDDTLNSIAELKQQQKSGKGDPTANAAQLNMLNTRLKDTNKDMGDKEKAIKAEVKKYREGTADMIPKQGAD